MEWRRALVRRGGGFENTGMFLGKNCKHSDGEVDEDWTWCEPARTESGPRQRVVTSLGELTEEDLAAGWEDPEA